MKEIEKIKNTIFQSINDQDAIVNVTNPRQDNSHFDAIVVSSKFIGKSLVKQHQMVMEPLKDLFSTFLHALSLKTFTPNEWNKE